MGREPRLVFVRVSCSMLLCFRNQDRIDFTDLTQLFLQQTERYENGAHGPLLRQKRKLAESRRGERFAHCQTQRATLVFFAAVKRLDRNVGRLLYSQQ